MEKALHGPAGCRSTGAARPLRRPQETPRVSRVARRRVQRRNTLPCTFRWSVAKALHGPTGCRSLRRRGVTTLEVIAAASVITVALASITPLFVRHARLVAESRRERIALEELANQAEQLAVVAGGDLAHHLATLAVSPEVADHLPGARLQARRGVATPLGEPVVLSLTWNSPGRNDHPLALVTWLPIPPPQTEKTP